MEISVQMDKFFKQHNMHYSEFQLDDEVEKFTVELDGGLKGEPSSLMMLPTYIYMPEGLPFERPVAVIDAGGTNLRVAVVILHEGKAVTVKHFKKYAMPGSQGTVTKDEFYSTMADYITPILAYSDTISFCFSYPAEIMPNQDGRALYMSKEISITGMENTLLGSEINKILKSRGLPEKHFVVLNDSVAALLGAVGHPKAKGHSGNIGFILGTGLNSCYTELAENILKIDTSGNEGRRMIINVESGGYSKFMQGTADKLLDNASNNPGKYMFEKMISGAYQGTLLYTTATLAAQEGIFSSKFAEGLGALTTFHLWDVAEFLESEGGFIGDICYNEDDRRNLRELIVLINHRAARLTAVSIAALMRQGGIGTNPEKPVAVTAEGTTFHKSPIFRELLDRYTKEYINDKLGLYCSYLYIEDATLLGTAVAGLS